MLRRLTTVRALVGSSLIAAAVVWAPTPSFAAAGAAEAVQDVAGGGPGEVQADGALVPVGLHVVAAAVRLAGHALVPSPLVAGAPAVTGPTPKPGVPMIAPV